MAALRLINQVRRFHIDSEAALAVAQALYEHSQPLAKRRGAPKFEQIDIVLHGDKASAEAHLAVMGVRGPTDVITIPYCATPTQPPRAEILVNPYEAVRMASERDSATLTAEEFSLSWSADLELALYMAHGFDHLALSDDSTPTLYRAMRKRELAWLRSIGTLPHLFKDTSKNA